MIAAFVFMSLNSQAQSEIYGGVGGPYTPMKFVIDIDSSAPCLDDFELPPADSTIAPRANEHQAELNTYGRTLSTLTES